MISRITEHIITIPLHPESINKVVMYGKDHGDIHTLKKRWQKLSIPFIQSAIDEGDIPQQFSGPISVLTVMYFEVQRLRDTDNYQLMVKGILDAMVQLRLLVDDNYKYLQYDGIRFVHEPGRPRVELYILERIKTAPLIEHYDEDKDKTGDSAGLKTNDFIHTRKHFKRRMFEFEYERDEIPEIHNDSEGITTIAREDMRATRPFDA